MNESPQKSTAPPASRLPRPTPVKRILLISALFSLIASAAFSMWQTTLKSFSDGAPLVRESHLHSIRAAFTWDPVDRELQRQISSQKREVERIDSWQMDPGLFYKYAEKNSLDDPDFRAEVTNAIERMRSGYERFVTRHPDYVMGHIAFGDFLEQVEDFSGATDQWAIAMKLDPNLPAAWDRQGRVARGNNDFDAMLDSYSHASDLEPGNWNYHYHVAALVFSNLDKAAAHYDEEPGQSATRAISHYRQALDNNPSNFQLAGELAFAYANLAPPDYGESMAAWKYSMRYARDETDLEGVYLSMARISIDTERFDAAREQIALSSLPTFKGQRSYLLEKIEFGEKKSRENGAY